MNSPYISLEKQLQAHFGYTTFQMGQEEIIRDVMRGKDVLGILPTGMGKSLCYQLPAKMLSGTTIVVSPLISLMIDQVKQLKALNFKEVVALNSFIDWTERSTIYQQLEKYKLIYVSPELLQQHELRKQLKKLSVQLFVIDEAHCISQWGHDFRPDYLRLSNIIADLNNPVVLALSATAPREIQQDIKHIIKRPKMVDHIYPMDRENIIFDVRKVVNDNEKNEWILEQVKQMRVPTIIYFSSRDATEHVTSFLMKNQDGLRVAHYHGGMETTDRISVQQQFMNNQLDVICCTSAFGMGINKKDIRFIIHYHIPTQIESFIQEVGRAGRDGKECVSVLLYSDHDHLLPAKLIERELPQKNELIYVFQQLYEMYCKGIQIPTILEQVESILQIQESQWKFLHYQFEKHDMIKDKQIVFNKDKWKLAFESLTNIIQERLDIKEKKLKEMVDWIHTDECLRALLYKEFQSSYTKPKHKCCSNCGFSLAEWNIQKPLLKVKDLTWEEKLQAIFTSNSQLSSGGKNA